MPQVQVHVNVAQQRHGMSGQIGLKRSGAARWAAPFSLMNQMPCCYGPGAVCSVGAGSGVLIGVSPL